MKKTFETFLLAACLFVMALLPTKAQGQVDRSYDHLDKERAKDQLKHFFTPKRLAYFSKQGEWKGKEEWGFTRSLEPLAYCQAALASGNKKAIAQANRYLENFPDYYQEWHRVNFLLSKYGALISEKAKVKLEGHLKSIADGFLEDHWNFVGTNDNFPCMATCGNILYGERTGNTIQVEKGRERLQMFKRQLTRSGVNTEYSSQAYCFLQIEPIAMIAEMAQDSTIKKLALEIEERLWIDVLAHYHLPTAKMVGPWSRAYQWDMRGVGLPFAMFDFVLGDLTPYFRLDDYFLPSEEWIKVRAASCYGNEYHCPKYLVDWVKNRQYPFHFLATADGCASYDDRGMEKLGLNADAMDPFVDYDLEPYGAWNSRIETYMTEKYTIGSASIPYHSGEQTESFLVTYPKKNIVESPKNTATIFSRFIVNGQEKLSGATDGYGDRGILYSERGRRLVTQHKNTAVVLYRPKRYKREQVSSLSVGIYIPNDQWGDGANTIDEIWVGDDKIPGKDFTAKGHKTIYVKDGEVYMAFVPLVPVNYGSEYDLRIQEREGYTVIEFFNYQGEPIDFTRNQFALIGNGFVCEVASTEEYSSFEQFRKKIGGAKVEDNYRAYQHYRKNPHRYVKYDRGDLFIETEYSPIDEGVRYQTVNGKNVIKPVLETDGLEIGRIPFLGY
ncbi:hypothetical protein SAMN05421766_10954 [Zobellia uliginosa]|uniref:Heparinase II/III-like protein n=1 Tax=Zobellia uliginosa TaxID=143224 RepID=A0ABY1L1B9_9FLAO|nr:hypothetical protein [Zobellia uliginosa]SIT08788.1 hypothetical protein SAMN05421766_10954 [Zobellia uliginosa]